MSVFFRPISPAPSPLSQPHPRPIRRRPRPKGLWKARVTVTSPRCLNSFSLSQRGHHHYSDDSDHESASSSSESSKKRRLLSSSASIASSDDDDDLLYVWDYQGSPPLSPLPLPVNPPLTPQVSHSHCPSEKGSRWRKRAKIMDTSSVNTASSSPQSGFDLEDWEDLKDLFTKAAETYESSEASEALPIIRGVIHECHRCLKIHHDPSLLFANPGSGNHSPDTLTPPAERLSRDWLAPPPTAEERPKRCTCIELPTAFHAIFGTALFLFGNLIAQDSSLALPGEPSIPSIYWLAALDVFETGENLPSRTHGLGCDAPEDWRMAIVWGRTLVAIADEAISRSHQPNTSNNATIETPLYPPDEPKWDKDSPFSIIAQRRPPITSRASLSTASPNDLMKLAMDQFSRGIFHMPHPSSSPNTTECFSRAKELYTIASEVLLISSKLSLPEERKYWASWADSVFSQIGVGGKGRVNRSRGECLLIVGSALAEGLEDELEAGHLSVLESEEAEEAREALSEAVVFFERAKGVGTCEHLTEKMQKQRRGKRKRGYPEPEVMHDADEQNQEGEDDDDLQALLAEALLTLANLTVDEKRREELYARAEKESGGGLGLDLMDVCES
ncbi:hypothetical protein Moror_13765 [Moniliophthora roreri MCA 2997]|uniref:Uncharacterized protein n=1 Tax=Moniliophthora roreri (strain MCA 2997) TaxID=1381753 RepID=V2XBZ0_MONRO|nr:hypothetical protein Moror_13765 [Moniliophthora roreri MCA 2997]